MSKFSNGVVQKVGHKMQVHQNNFLSLENFEVFVYTGVVKTFILWMCQICTK